MNHIETYREDVRKEFNQINFTKEIERVVVSPTNSFHFATTRYSSVTNQNLYYFWEETKVFNSETGKSIFEFIKPPGQLFNYAWLQTNKIEYLVFQEDTWGGQTVIDLTNSKVASYSPDEDGFAWMEFYLSPNGKILAVDGAYWGPFALIKFYDFTNPLDLPLAEIEAIELAGGAIEEETVIGWVNDKIFKTEIRTIMGRGLNTDTNRWEKTLSAAVEREIVI